MEEINPLYVQVLRFVIENQKLSMRDIQKKFHLAYNAAGRIVVWMEEKGYAFETCANLTSIVIGASVSEISWAAFYGCINLTDVYYKGTASDWDNIYIDDYENDDLINATRYYYSESQPTEAGNYWHYDTDGVTPIIWDYTA